MFELAQEDVSVRQVGTLALRQQSPVREAAKTDERMSGAQPQVAPAEGQLQSLCDELNFTYAAATELDVEAARVLRMMTINLLLRQPHVFKGALDRHVPRIDAMTHALGKARVERGVSGGCAGANQRLKLPGLSVLAVVTHGFINRGSERAVSPEGSEAQVHALDHEFAYLLADDARDARRQ